MTINPRPRVIGSYPITTPFGRLVSQSLDRVLIELDAMPSAPFRRRWLRLEKRILELRVPAGGAA